MTGCETGLFGCSHDIMEARMISALTPALSPTGTIQLKRTQAGRERA